VIRISGKPRAGTRMLAAAAAACAGVGLAACTAAPGSAPAAPATHTVTAPAPASQAPGAGSSPAAASPAAGGAATAASDKLPDYQPSTLVSRSASSTVLASPDPVGKIGAFYKNALAQGGWHVTSFSMSAYHASFTAYRSSEGASISVYARGSGSGISISTHPM
jgi:hypothetical protein